MSTERSETTGERRAEGMRPLYTRLRLSSALAKSPPGAADQKRAAAESQECGVCEGSFVLVPHFAGMQILSPGWLRLMWWTMDGPPLLLRITPFGWEAARSDLQGIWVPALDNSHQTWLPCCVQLDGRRMLADIADSNRTNCLFIVHLFSICY